jgi:serine/threonine protein kinase
LKQTRKYTVPADAFHERNILLRLNHPNILKLLGTFYAGNIFFLFELYQGKSCTIAKIRYLVMLQFHTNSTELRSGDTGTYNKEISKHHLHPIVRQLLSAIAFLHSKDILHRDIKPKNILIAQGSKIKLSNFGVAEWLPPVNTVKYLSKFRGILLIITIIFNTGCGYSYLH